MELIFSIAVGLMAGCGVFLMLRGHTFSIIMGITLMSYAVNLFLFASGGLALNSAAVLGESETYSDPLPQALVLTAIVIGFAMTAFALILAIKARADLGSDHVNGSETNAQNSDQRSLDSKVARRGENPTNNQAKRTG